MTPVAELIKQLDRHRVRDYLPHFKLACGYEFDIALPILKIGVVIDLHDLSQYPPDDWAVLNVTRNVILSGDAVQRLKVLIKARELEKCKIKA
jgi:hypothetical protein